MEKMKVNFDIEFEQEVMHVQDKNGNDVVILNRIPFAEKELFVQELAALTIGSSDELGVCYETMNQELFFNYMTVKYYTNIDVDGFEDIADYRRLYDYCQTVGIVSDKVRDFLEDDHFIVREMLWRYRMAVERLYETEHSLGYRVKQLLDTDVDTNNAETRELIEKLIDMKGALKEKEEQGKVLSMAGKKNVKTGGANISLAKR